MPKLDLTTAKQMKGLGAAEILSLKGPGFSWNKPAGKNYLVVTDVQMLISGSIYNGESGDGTFAIVSGGVTYTWADGPNTIDTKNVTSLARATYRSNFNGDISQWNTGAVTSLYGTFHNNAAFNQNVGNWNVSNVTRFDQTFQNADAFAYPLDKWDIRKATTMANMLSTNMGIGNANYSKTLVGWANRVYSNGGLPQNITLGAANNRYTASSVLYPDAWPAQAGQQFTNAVAARAYLVSRGWIITDAGAA